MKTNQCHHSKIGELILKQKVNIQCHLLRDLKTLNKCWLQKEKDFYNKDLTSNSYDGDPDNSDKTMLMIIMSKLMIDTWISKKQMELEVESQNQTQGETRKCPIEAHNVIIHYYGKTRVRIVNALIQ